MPTNLLSRRFTPRFFPTLGREFDRLDANIRRMFDNPFAPATELFAELPQPIGWMPPVQITETAEELLITAELPGIDPKNVHVELDNDLLTIRGEKLEEHVEDEKKDEKEMKDVKYHLVERTFGTFFRSFTLPRTVDPTKVVAEFDKGVLMVKLPKVKEARPRGREIAVTAK